MGALRFAHLDTVGYTLAGRLTNPKGGALRTIPSNAVPAMAALASRHFFTLGDKDLAVHLFRTEQLREGPLVRGHRIAARTLGVASRLLPMSDDDVATRVKTPEGWLGFQEFFVRERCKPDVLDVAYDGATRPPAPGSSKRSGDADAIIVCPVESHQLDRPDLAVPGIREALGKAKVGHRR